MPAAVSDWTRVSARLVWEDEQADGLNIEVVPRGGPVQVDDVGVRKVAP